MTPSAFSYARPSTVDEAVALLSDYGTDARILAGGQSLIPSLVQRNTRTRWVIDINRIPELDRIEIGPDHVRMGALVRQEQARLSPVVREQVSGLSEALEWVASSCIRERGTVVGNLIANAPGTELPAVAIALGAQFTVRDRTGEQLVPAADVLGAARRLAPEALVTHVHWPRAAGRGGFYEVSRREGHAPVVGALVTIGEAHCRVGLCGVTAVGIACPTVAHGILTRFPKVLRADEIDELLTRDLPQSLYGNAFVGAAYRRDVAPVVIQRASAAAAQGASV